MQKLRLKLIPAGLQPMAVTMTARTAAGIATAANPLQRQRRLMALYIILIAQLPERLELHQCSEANPVTANTSTVTMMALAVNDGIAIELGALGLRQ